LLLPDAAQAPPEPGGPGGPGVLRTPGVVVFAHGLRSSKESPRNVPVAEALVEAGLAAFLFDFSGHGDSGGTIAEDGLLEQQAADLDAAVAELEELPVDASRVAVIGSSSGGSAAVACPSRDEWRAMVLRGPNLRPVWDRAGEIEVETLVLVGEHDPLRAEARDYYERLRCEKGWAEIPGGDHLFSDPESFAVMQRTTVDWLTSRLAR
jgi:pimeloyl-ACP methyl ester carboxylesterase